MPFWIVASKHSRDESTKDWDSKWTADQFLRTGEFCPTKRHQEFQVGDRCFLRIFGWQILVADFRIASDPRPDKDGDWVYSIDEINEWSFGIPQSTLPPRIAKHVGRNPSEQISEAEFNQLLGIRDYAQNLRLNYRNRLTIHVSEREVETLIDAKNALASIGLTIVDRQLELTSGNIIDLLCQDAKGDLFVVELKKQGPNETIGQLAGYITDVREHRAKPTQKVRGIILALDVDDQLIRAARAVDFEVLLYQLAFG